MKNLIVSFMIVVAFALTALAQDQNQDKKQSQVRTEENKELKEQTQEKKQSQVQTQENKKSKEQTQEMKQVAEHKQVQQYSDMDGDGVNDHSTAKMAKDNKSNPKSEVGHGEGAGTMQRPRDRDQDGKMQPGSGEGPKGDTPRSQKGSRKGQK